MLKRKVELKNNMEEFRKSFKEAFEISKPFGGRASTGQTSIGPAQSNDNTLFTSVANAIPREEEIKSHDTKILPFPLDRIVDQLVTCYEDLVKVKSTINASIRGSTTFDESQRNLLKKDIKRVDRCIEHIKIISKDVEEMKF